MAWHEIPEYGVWVDDADGEVRDEAGTTVGYMDESGTVTPIDEFDIDDGLDPVSAVPFEDPLEKEVAELRKEILDLREQELVSEGYAFARAEDAAEEDEDEIAEREFVTALSVLESRLGGRKLSTTDVAAIARNLPDGVEYDDADVLDTATRLGIGSFTGESGNPASQARAAENRANYLSARAQEMDADDQAEYVESGGTEGTIAAVEESGGLFGDLFRNEQVERSAHEARLAQSTADPNDY